MLRTWLKSFGKLLYKHHMTLLLVGCLTHKSESFRLRFVLFATVHSADFPLFPSSPARSNSILGQNWVRNRGIPIFLAWRPKFFLRDGMAHGIIKVQSQEKL